MTQQAKTQNTHFNFHTVQFRPTALRQRVSFPSYATQERPQEQDPKQMIKQEDTNLPAPASSSMNETVPTGYHFETGGSSHSPILIDTDYSSTLPPQQYETTSASTSYYALATSSLPSFPSAKTAEEDLRAFERERVNWEERHLTIAKRLKELTDYISHTESTFTQLRERCLIVESSFCLILNPYRIDQRINLNKYLNNTTQ